jgi:peroxiredoxin
MRTRFVICTFGFVMFAFFSFSLKREMRSDGASQLMIQRGMVAPDFQATDMNGNRVDLYEIVKGHKAVLVTFWATWCDPCRVELANFEKMYPSKKDAGMEFLAVNLDPSELQHFPFVNELPFPIVPDQEQRIVKLYGIRSLPSSVIVASGTPPRIQNSMEGSIGAESVAPLFGVFSRR